jgi:hypothetical protein
MDEQIQQGIQKSRQLVKDDLTEEGQRKLLHRSIFGQRMLQQAERKHDRSSAASTTYGFGCIETLPNCRMRQMRDKY